MFTVKPKTTENIGTFFDNYNLNNRNYYNTDGQVTDAIDGTGKKGSVRRPLNQQLVDFIKEKFIFSGKINILDVGAGACYLQEIFDADDSINGYSIEGYAESDLTDMVVGNKSNISIVDFTKSLKSTNLEKSFHLTTSFEVIEHIPRNLQKEYWENMIYLSDYHFCSIHCGGIENKSHQTIMNRNKWQNFFELNNIKWISVEKELRKKYKQLTYWERSGFYILEFPEKLNFVWGN